MLVNGLASGVSNSETLQFADDVKINCSFRLSVDQIVAK